MRRGGRWLALFVAATLLLTSSSGADDNAPPENGEGKAWAEEAAQLALAEARSMKLQLHDGTPLQLVEAPVLKWSNNFDASVYGSVFVWTMNERPAAISSIFKVYAKRNSFNAELHSLTAGPLVGQKAGVTFWEPPANGVQFEELEAAPPPAKSPSARLTQMRELARQFSAELTTVVGKTRHELRLLPQPLQRYRGNGDKFDGAIFAFARATDPDVLVLLEAQLTDKSPHWRFAVARMHVGALTLRYNEMDVWRVEELAQPYSRKQGAYSQFSNLPEPTLN